MNELQQALDLINEQTKGMEHTTVQMCGRQLSDILRAEPQHAAIVLEDLKAGQTVKECEKQIKALADEIHKKTHGNVGISPEEAENIIRTFYGIGKLEREPQPIIEDTETGVSDDLDLFNFL